jgi:hypothetical protein
LHIEFVSYNKQKKKKEEMQSIQTLALYSKDKKGNDAKLRFHSLFGVTLPTAI